jgi:hypothetical protein
MDNVENIEHTEIVENTENTERILKILQEYRDKSYVSNILCEKSYEFNNILKQFINIPLILTSSIMGIMNSWDLENPEHLKIANIVLNSATTLILSFQGNFRIVEKISDYRNTGIKFTKLCHFIEDKLANNDDINRETVRNIIKEYDLLCESLEHPYPSHIRNAVIKLYSGKKCLPNILNCTTDFKVTSAITSSNANNIVEIV